jgi:hypothetical protein
MRRVAVGRASPDLEDRTMRPTAAAVLGSLTLTFAQGGIAGGPLTPPAGPVAPTPGPEPRTAVNDLPGSAIALHVISRPGSYYFSGDINVATPGLHGVYIDTPGPVTIDGMGFTISGAPGTLNAFVMFDDTGIPLRATVQNMHSWGFDAWAVKWVGPSDSNSPEEDLLELEDIDVLVSGSSGVAVQWHGDITLKRGYIDNGGLFQSDGALTISHTIINGHPSAPAIEADGLFMTDVFTRGGRGVVAKKPREIVVVGSKVKEVVRGVAFDLAEGAVVTNSQADGTVDAEDYALWRENFGTIDVSDPFYAPSSFGANSRIESSVFLIEGSGDPGGRRVDCGAGTVFVDNTITYTGLENHAALVRFSGGQCTIAGNTARGIPAGSAGFEVNDLLNLVHDNTFIGSGTSSIGVVGTAGRSVFRNNTMMNLGVPFDLFGVGGNLIGAVLTPTSAPASDTPDRNLVIPPAAPVR